MGVFGIPAPVVAGAAVVTVAFFVISLVLSEITPHRWKLYVSTYIIQFTILTVLLITWWTIPLSPSGQDGAFIGGMFIIPTELVFCGFVVGCAKEARNSF